MRISTLFALILAAPVALAHPEHAGWTGGDFAAGMAHVMTGVDHWITWLALGSLMAIASWRWRIPVSMVALLYLGVHAQLTAGFSFVAGSVVTSLLVAAGGFAVAYTVAARRARIHH